MDLIKTSHLKMWANSKVSESRFPYIVKKLITAVIKPEKLRIPSDDAVWIPGYDGVVLNNESNKFVPSGFSVWEVGTSADYKRKARGDYEKRSKEDYDGKQNSMSTPKRSETIFVFVTPRVWKDKNMWVEEKRQENIWKDVRVIDGVDLQDWLEEAPAVTLQFAAELDILPEKGLQSPREAWEEWSYLTDPPTSEELVVVGREKQQKELLNRLVGRPSIFKVRADSGREAWGFTLAVLRQIDLEEKKQSILSRTIVAENAKVVRRLSNLENHIVVLKRAEDQVSGALTSRGCHVILPEGNGAYSERNVIELERPSRYQFTQILEGMNIESEEAERISRECGLSITIMQRLRAFGNSKRPQWSNDTDNITYLIPALLVGRWDDNNKADQAIIKELADEEEYNRAVSKIRRFLNVDEPPLRQINNLWTLTAPVDAFQLIARYIEYEDLERFKKVFREVFKKIDPKVELPPSEWLYHDAKNNEGHSDWLRTGMAETLLLIAERGKDARLSCIGSGSAYAKDVVKGLSGLNDDWRVLASLREQYPLLMEAAPDPLLNSLEYLLEEKIEDMKNIFTDEDSYFGTKSLHTGLLWGLETLAWSTEYLPRVSLVLAKLASIDPGGQLSNRPINSLRNIFLWWHPGTSAPIENRLLSIKIILNNKPKIGWKLITDLLPKSSSSISTPTSKPRWRRFDGWPEDARSKSGQYHYLSSIIDLALENAGSNMKRWVIILDSLSKFNDSQIEKTLNLLESVVDNNINKDEKYYFWMKLRDFISNHHTYNEAIWALDEEVINRLESILSAIQPADPIQNNMWLFEAWHPKPLSGEDNFENAKKEVQKLREEAIKEVIEKKGINGIAELGTSIENPGFVTSIAVPLINDIPDLLNLINTSISVGEKGMVFASYVSTKALDIHGDKWIDLVVKNAESKNWKTKVITYLVLLWPNSQTTWEIVKSLGEEVESIYWRKKGVNFLDTSPEDITYQVNKLIEVGRAIEIFKHIAIGIQNIPSESLLHIFKAALKEMVNAKDSEGDSQLSIGSYELKKFIEEIKKRDDIERDKVAECEYKILPALGILDAKNLTLHEFMAEDPEFFVDVISDAFLPSNRDETQKNKSTKVDEARAMAAYTLLSGMEEIPGLINENEIDEDFLLKWINEVRDRAKKIYRTEITDTKIGEILAHAPNDPGDKGWPHKAIRNAIEKIANENIEKGINIGRHNMRGVFTKEVFEGGKQERDLANQYREWANICRVKWIRTALLLERIAKSWDEMAEREDIRAEQEKLNN